MRTSTLNAKIFSLGLLLNCASAPVPVSEPADCRTAESVLTGSLSEPEALQDLLDRYDKLGRFSGVLLVARDGEVIFEDAVGLADRESRRPNRLDTQFDLGSLTKQFTAAAILDLEAAGRLSVEDTIAEHLPAYSDEKWGSVTIDQLLSMSSGIPSLGRRGDGLEDVKETGLAVTLDEQIAFSSGMDLLLEPGSRYRYSNTNYVILARIIEEVSGMSWADYLERRLFDRAGLTRTTIPREMYPPGDAAIGYFGYEPVVRAAETSHPTWGWGAGGAWSTATDLLKWAEALQSGRILPEEQIEKFFAHHTDWGKRGGYYAYGWWGTEVHGVHTLSHGGTIGGFRTGLYIVPDDDLVVVALSNQIPELRVDTAARIAESAIGLLRNTAPELPPMPAERFVDSSLIVGDYLLENGRVLHVEKDSSGLVLRSEGAWSPIWIDRIMREPQGRGIAEANRFVESLIEEEFEEVMSMLDPEWRANVTAANFAEPWMEWTDGKGPVEGYQVFGRTERELISVEYIIGLRDSLIYLEVVLNQDLDVGGWWESASVPPRALSLTPAADGTFFLDGFRWREADVRVQFEPECGLARSLTIGSERAER